MPHDQTVQHKDGARLEQLVIYPSRVKEWLILLGAIVFVLLGLWIGTPAVARKVPLWEMVIATYVGVPFFSFAALYASYRLVRRRPAIVLDATGITDTASAIGAGKLRWDELSCIVVYRYRGQPFLGMFPKDLPGFMARQKPLRRLAFEANLKLGIAPVNIPQVMIPMKVKALAQLMRERYGVRVEGDA